MPAPEGADQEAYENYCSAIEEWNEVYDEFKGYAAEALNAENRKYRENALAKACSYAMDLLELEEQWQDMLEKFPVDGDSVEDLLEKTEISPRMSPGKGMSIRPRPEEELSPEQKAAIAAVSENYHIVERKDQERFFTPLDVDMGNLRVKIDV